MSYALAQGRGVALAVVGGVILGDLLAMSANLLGLGVIMTASASLFTVMNWTGAAYLAWMGWRMIRSAGRAMADLAEVAGKSKGAAHSRPRAPPSLSLTKSIGDQQQPNRCVHGL